MMHATRPVAALISLFFVMTFTANIHADATLWTYKADKDVKWHRVTDLGTVLLGTDDFILCLDPENGKQVWKREDLQKVPESLARDIQGTPLLLVSTNSGFARSKTKLYALDVMTGETVWERDEIPGFTVQTEPVYRKNYVLVFTSQNKGQNKDNLDIVALDMASGDVVWETEFDDKIDLHEAESSGRFSKSFDLSGHQPPTFDDNAIYFTYAGLHVHDIDTGALLWKSKYDVTEGQIKRGNAPALIEGDVIYTSAKGKLKAFNKSNGNPLWESKDFGGAIAQMAISGNTLYGRLGGHFYNRSKKEWERKKPLGVVAVNKNSGEMVWRYKDADDSITNMVLLEDLQTILIADKKDLIGLDMNNQGKAEEKFKVKLEFKKKLGAGDIAAGAGRFALGGIRGLKGGVSKDDVPVAISMQENGIAVVQGKQHLLAFSPATQEIVWSVQYKAPGVSGWQKMVMGSITAAAYTAATYQAANSYYGSMENRWANQNRANLIASYHNSTSKRFSATRSSGAFTYILTEIESGDDKGAGIVGVNMANGEAERQILFDDKEPNYSVDEFAGRVFNLKKKKELSAFSVQ